MASIAQELSVLRGQWQIIETPIDLANPNQSYQLCGANPLRWALVFSNGGTGSPGTFVEITSIPDNVSTFLFDANFESPPIYLSYRDVAAAVQIPWYAWWSGPGSTTMTVTEVLAVSGEF